MKYDLQADYLALSRLQPGLPGIWSRLAQVQIDCGDVEGARSSLLRLLALDDSNAEAHRRLAAVYQKLHLAREAEQELAAASGTPTTSGHKARLQLPPPPPGPPAGGARKPTRPRRSRPG